VSRTSRPVVLMVHDYPPFTGGGLALGVREIAAELDDDFSFRVLSSRPRDHFADDRHRLDAPDGESETVSTFASPRRALRWLREADAIVLHWTFSFRRLSTLLLVAAPLLRKPTVFVVHTAPDHCDYNRLRHLPLGLRGMLVWFAGTAARRCSQVVALSHTHAAALTRTGFPSPHVVFLPVAAHLYDCAWHRRERRPVRTVMILGELSELKGADAIPGLLPVLTSDFRVRIAGRGPFARVVESAAAALPAASRANVEISDRVEPSQVVRLYDEADCLLVLSRTESMSRVTLEAMLSGVIVLARPVGGIRDLVVDDRTGYLIDPDDPASVLEVLLRLARNPSKVDRVRRRAQAFASRACATSRRRWRQILLDVTS